MAFVKLSMLLVVILAIGAVWPAEAARSKGEKVVDYPAVSGGSQAKALDKLGVGVNAGKGSADKASKFFGETVVQRKLAYDAGVEAGQVLATLSPDLEAVFHHGVALGRSLVEDEADYEYDYAEVSDFSE